MTPPRPAVALALTSALVLTACGSGDGADSADSTGDRGGVQVVAAFYPLQFAVQQVAGEHAEVSTLTGSGLDPHDVELSPRDVAGAQQADLLVYSSGMQPAVDEVATGQAAGHALDVNEAADLVPTGPPDHAEHSQGHDDGHDHGGVDPHFWLDPERYAAVGQAIAEQLAEVDPEHAEDYAARSEGFAGELAELDQQLADGLADCEQVDVVTTHAAFGYLTDRYGLHQVPITGLSAEGEATPARMAEITEAVRESGVDTIYAETLLGSDLADTVAAETGAQVLLLDPVEGITDSSPGGDYFAVMRANLAALQEGQQCR